MHDHGIMSDLQLLLLHTYSKGHCSAVYITKPSLYFTCRASPDGRLSVAPDSWVCPCLYRSSPARWSACVVRHSPRSGTGRRVAGGWTQWARGLGTSSVLCGSASCCRFHPCWGPPCYRSQCRRSVASCSCCWGCRLWLHQDKGCSFSRHQDSETLLGLQWASLTAETERETTQWR